ncbi:MAG: septum formation initiator family protein, partial [Acidimicrobiales bacterium]|nr:septum formation initiator family protein [Acidimicrobiales bacterium]
GSLMRRLLWPVVASLAFIAVVFLFVLPTRTYLEQHNAINQASSQIATLRQQNRQLEKRAADLRNPAVIGRIARFDYGMVNPGQPARVVLPPVGSSGSHHSSKKAGAKHPARRPAASSTGAATSSTTTTVATP